MTRPIVVFDLLALFAGCGVNGSGDAQGVSSSASAGPPSMQLSVPDAPPKPDDATAAAYVADLEAIDPDIVHGKPDKAVSRGRDQCSSVAQWPDDQERLVGLVQRRFISPDHPEGFGQAAERILAVVRRHLRPGY